MEPDVEILPNVALDAARATRAAKLAELEVRRIARSLIVPVDDLDVRHELRARAQPVCFFGEDAHDRRERLRARMAEEKMRGVAHPIEGGEGKREGEEGNGQLMEERKEAEYYTEGTPELQALRRELAQPSLERAMERLEREKHLRGVKDKTHPDRWRVREEEHKVVTVVRSSFMVSSQVGDRRPLSAISIGESSREDGHLVATGSWSGDVCVWDSGDSCVQKQTISAHTERISSVFIPRSNPGVLLTSSADCSAALHRRKDEAESLFTLQHTFREHVARVTDAKMHPFRNSLVVTSSFDGSFILYDDGKVVLRQESGHSRVYRVNFHDDGGILGTSGLDGALRIWDLRSGRAVMTMTKAHTEALGIEFSGDGTTVASCGADNLVKIWDLRTRRCAKTIAAHRSLISGMRFGGGVNSSDVLFTCSFDKSVKCWGARRNWGLLAAHTGHDDKVTAIDCTRDGRTLVSACYDKTWKLWGDSFL